MKVIVVLMLGAIVYSLGSGLWYLNKDRHGSGRLARALTWRIALSVALFVLLIVSAQQGWLQPHNIGRAPG
ncbi:MAG: twin transmembrane helix small protein [Pseudomonadota bacterium]